MAKDLVQLAEDISTLTPNELQTLGKIVMAKTQQMAGSGPQNVPGPMGGPTGPAPVPPQMQQAMMNRRRMANPQMRPPMARDAVMPGLLGRG